MQPYQQWRPSGYQHSPPRTHPFLTHHSSMLDLHDQGWPRSESPSTSSSSSSSALDGALTPTASSSETSTPSRSTTPKARASPTIEWSRSEPFRPYSKNPFFNNRSRPSPPVSPKSMPHSRPKPDSSSRCSTPVAPVPVRPVMTTTASGNQALRFDSGHSSPSNGYEEPPHSPTPTISRERERRQAIVEDFLPPPQVVGDPFVLQRELMANIPLLVKRKNWAFGVEIIKWAVVNQKTALLLWVCDELDNIPKAVFFTHRPLTDKLLPFTDADLNGIITNPARVIAEQWKIGILKNLPRDGRYVEFQTQDTVPLMDLGPVGPVMPSTVKTRTKIKYSDGFDSLFYVRKRLEVPADRPRDKTTILNQIKAYAKLDHPTIAKIVASYSQGQVVAFIMPYAEINLADFLDEDLGGFSQSAGILGWIKDLASALAYMHSQGIEHRNIRPAKILVDIPNQRIFFTVFAVCHPMRKSSPGLFAPFSNDPSYIYAAPELITGRDSEPTRADVFSLGCVFLEMVAFAKGRTVDDLRQYRSAHSHDISFHANLGRVMSYIDLLRDWSIKWRNEKKKVQLTDACENILLVTKGMLHPEPGSRPSMRRAEQILVQGTGRRQQSMMKARAEENFQRPEQSMRRPEQNVWKPEQSLRRQEQTVSRKPEQVVSRNLEQMVSRKPEQGVSRKLEQNLIPVTVRRQPTMRVRRNSLDLRATGPGQSGFFDDLKSLQPFDWSQGHSQSVYGGE